MRLRTHLDNILWLGNGKDMVLLTKKEFTSDLPFQRGSIDEMFISTLGEVTVICLPLGLGRCQPTSLPVSSWCVSVNDVALTCNSWQRKLSFYLQVNRFLAFEGCWCMFMSCYWGDLLNSIISWQFYLYHCLGQLDCQRKVVDREGETELTSNCTWWSDLCHTFQNPQ